MGKHRGADYRTLSAALRFSCTQQVLGLSVGDLDAPTSGVSLDDLLRPSLWIRVEEDHIWAVTGWVMAEDNTQGLIACTMIPERPELMDHQLRFFSVAKDLNLSPRQVFVIYHGL